MQQGMAGLRDVSIMLNLTTGISSEVGTQQQQKDPNPDPNPNPNPNSNPNS